MGEVGTTVATNTWRGCVVRKKVNKLKITGTSSSITFDLENGYSITGTGEILVGGRFAVDTDSLVQWNEPHQDEPFTSHDLTRLKEITLNMMRDDTVHIIFD